MKIAIHHKEGTFSDRWIAYCKEKKIPYKIVDAYASDIVEQANDCDAFMWHHHHADAKDVLFAKQLLFSLQQAGKVVFPDFNIGWHFDDKVGQKYLFEALGLPLVPSYVFYSKKNAMDWAKTTSYPKVFKLRGGAGSSNVRLVKNARVARKLICQSFGRGFRPVDRLGILVDALKRKKWLPALKSFVGFVCPWLTRERFMPRHKGYVYFQDFVPGMKFDIRVIVIGDKAFAIKRLCREKDFRASGSGRIIYEREEQDLACVELAFRAAKAIGGTAGVSSLGFDFVLGDNNQPLLVEMSYGYDIHGYDPCPGYWTSDGQWHGGRFIPQYWMIDWICECVVTHRGESNAGASCGAAFPGCGL